MNADTCVLKWHTLDELEQVQRADPVWFGDNGLTNYALRDGARVRLLCPAVAESDKGHATLAKATVGTVVTAQFVRTVRPPKATRTPRTFKYLAVVQFEVGSVTFTARLPHNAIKEIT